MKLYLLNLLRGAFPADYATAWFLFRHPDVRRELSAFDRKGVR